MKYLQILFLVAFHCIINAQTPVLVKDINPGPFSSANLNLPHIQINDVIYYVGDIQGKRDLYAVKDGEVQLLSTMCPSNCAAFQFFYFEFQDKLFFIKQIDAKINQLWESDGSIEGTKLVFEYPGLFKSAVVGKNNKIYLGINNRNTFKDEVFISDGTTAGTKRIAIDVNLRTNSEFGGKPIKYNNGVAFANILNDTLKLFEFNEEILFTLSSLQVKQGSSISGFKTIGEKDLLILVHSNNALSSSLLKFNNTNKIIKNEITLPFTNQERPYFKEFNKDSLVLFYHTGGHFLISGNPLNLTNITPFSHTSFNFSSFELYYSYNGNAIYNILEDDGVILKDKAVLFDKNINNKKVIDLNLTPRFIIGRREYAFNVTEESSGKLGRITMYNLFNKSTKMLLNINQTFSTNSIKPLGLIGSKLYFLANLNESFGKELYYVETGIPTSTKEDFSVIQNPFTIEVRSNLYKVKSESNHAVNLEILDTSGRLLHTRVIDTNQEYHFDENLRGLMFMKVIDLKSSYSKSVSVYLP